MSNKTIDRLKELLFDSETRALSDLSQRVETLSDTEKQRRAELERRIDEVFERAGTAERFERSVAATLDRAMRTAEIERHEEMAGAIAPLVVKTIKTELKNSQDEMVEALYPITGRMVKAYVASAMKDLMDQINRRLESNPLMLRLTSLTTGRTMAEVAMAETQRLEVVELYLIRRGTGELIARWPEGPGSANRDQVMSGVLTAINEFAGEAFKAEGAALRQIDLGPEQVYLRASPVYLLAARCSGTAPASVEEEIDGAFLDAISRHHDDAAGAPRLLADLSTRLESGIAAKQEAFRAENRARPLRTLGFMVGVPLLAWLSWTLYANFETTRARSVATTILLTSPEMQGYPASVVVERLGRSLTVTGLAPSRTAKDDLVQRLQAALPRAAVVDQLTVLPSGMIDIEPRIAEVRRDIAGIEAEAARVVVHRLLDRATRRLETSLADIARIRGTAKSGSAGAGGTTAAAAIEKALRDVTAHRATFASPAAEGTAAAAAAQMLATAAELRRAAGELAAVGGDAVPAPVPSATRRSSRAPTALEAAEQLEADTNRLSLTALAVAVVQSIKPAPVVVTQPAATAPQPTARERITAFTRSHAVFFGEGTAYRQQQRAEQTLDQLAALIKEADVLVRVVGYTDERGAQSRNNSLSQQRAERVVAALVERGVQANRLVAIGRTNLVDLSPSAGNASPNRRVEFEVGFEGEAGE